MFITKPGHHSFNLKQSPTYEAKPALLTAPDGNQEPAVVLFGDYQVKTVFTIPEALRLANEIADAVDNHRFNNHANN